MNSALFLYHLSSRTKKSKRQFLVAEIAIVVEILMDSINVSFEEYDFGVVTSENSAKQSDCS